MEAMKQHEKYMSIALDIAEGGLGYVFPNPSVGCVIVRNSDIISEGRTGDGGNPHAEVIALQKCKEPVEGSILYTTLEPCCHHSDKISCVDQIIKSGIKKVVIAIEDPDPRMSGKGISKLKKNGVEIVYGVKSSEAKELNVGFFHAQSLGRPFITIKIAMSLDGMIALSDGRSKWITSEYVRTISNEMRSKYDAIMTGSGTMVMDDPHLTCRTENHRSPIRIVIDRKHKIQPNYKLADGSVETWVITNNYPKKYKVPNVRYLKVSSSIIDDNLVSIAKKLQQEQITRLLVEGGRKLNTNLLKQGLVDRIIIFRSGKIIGSDGLSCFANLNMTDLVDMFSLHDLQHFENEVMEVWNRKKKLC